MKKKGHCANCNRSTRAFFIYNRFLTWYRCSRCWTPNERRLVQLKLNVSVLHSTDSHARRVTTVTRSTKLEEQTPHRLQSVEGSRNDFSAVSMFGLPERERNKDRTGEVERPMTVIVTEKK